MSDGGKTVVVGTGAWGVAIAIQVAAHGRPVALLARTCAEAAALHKSRHSPRHPAVPFPPLLDPTSDPVAAFTGTDVVVLAVPAQTMRANLLAVARSIDPSAAIVVASKGLEVGTCLRMSEVVAEEAGGAARILALSGPNLAAEVAAGMHAASVVAGLDQDIARRVQARLGTPAWRLYLNDDLVGVELGAALKNVVAVAVGIADGLGHGENARAALVTRGLAEISRLAIRLGADARTLAGLAGLGDLVVTCASPRSRNRQLGLRLAAGERLEAILATSGTVAEGVPTTHAATEVARRAGVEMPIATVLARVFDGTIGVREAAAGLVGRAPGRE